MSIGHKATIQAVKAVAATGADLLTDAKLLQAVKDDFTKNLKGRSYESLCDVETNPLGALDQDEKASYDCAIHAAMEHFGIKDEH